MAATISQVVTNTVIGDLRMKIVNWTAGGTAEAADMGMGNIVAAHVTLKSGLSMTSQIRVLENQGASGTSTVGTLALTSTVANDVYRVIVFAKS